jgi:hypothetical protein
VEFVFSGAQFDVEFVFIGAQFDMEFVIFWAGVCYFLGRSLM